MKVIIINHSSIPENFTGILKIISENESVFFKNGKIHNEHGAAAIHADGRKLWWFKSRCYGTSTESFTNESWKKFVKKLKQEEKFKIFI